MFESHATKYSIEHKDTVSVLDCHSCILELECKKKKKDIRSLGHMHEHKELLNKWPYTACPSTVEF